MIKKQSLRPRAREDLFLFSIFPWIVQIWVSHLTFLCLGFSTSKGVGWLSKFTVSKMPCSTLAVLGWPWMRAPCSELLLKWRGGTQLALTMKSAPDGAEEHEVLSTKQVKEALVVKFARFLEALIFLCLFWKGFCIFYCKIWKLYCDIRNCTEWSHSDGVTSSSAST